jgi:hypothetical protein
MPSFSLSKSRTLAGLQCPKRLWLQTYQRELAGMTPATQAALDTGCRVGEVARTLFPDGVLVEHVDNIPAAPQTRAVLGIGARPCSRRRSATWTCSYAPTCSYSGNAGHRLIEVKSSSRVKDYHLDDCAIQAWVTRGAGLELERIDLAVLDTSFFYLGDGDYGGLFRFEDVTGAMAARVPRVAEWVRDSSAMLAGPMPRWGRRALRHRSSAHSLRSAR